MRRSQCTHRLVLASPGFQVFRAGQVPAGSDAEAQPTMVPQSHHRTHLFVNRVLVFSDVLVHDRRRCRCSLRPGPLAEPCDRVSTGTMVRWRILVDAVASRCAIYLVSGASKIVADPRSNELLCKLAARPHTYSWTRPEMKRSPLRNRDAAFLRSFGRSRGHGRSGSG